MVHILRVAILDDHQSIIDGYRYRLEHAPDVKVVATASFGEQLEPMLAAYEVDVLLLDMQVPTSQESAQPYPVLQVVPDLLETYPWLSILVISMYAKRVFVRAVMEAGASGYILKDDNDVIVRLADVVKSVAAGDIFLSRQAEEQLHMRDTELPLTNRQTEVLTLLAADPGTTTGSIADRLNLAHSTVRNLLSDAYLRLDVRNRSAAILKAQQLGLIHPAAHDSTRMEQ